MPDDLKKRIEAAGLQSRIVITGELPIEEVQRWYQRLTIYAFTSRNEGFGLTLIEAMSAGAALVASRAGAAELVVEDGVTGVLTPPGDVDALVAALEPLMRDPAVVRRDGRARPRAGARDNSVSMRGKRESREVLSRNWISIDGGVSRFIPSARSPRPARARRSSTTSEAGMSRMQRWSFMVQTGRWQGWHGTTVLVWTVAARPLSGAQR